MGGLDKPSEIASIDLSQVVNYSEFLNELARQRHTIVKSFLDSSTLFAGYSAVKERNNNLLDKLDTLIQDTFSHIEVTTVASTDSEPKQDLPEHFKSPKSSTEETG